MIMSLDAHTYTTDMDVVVGLDGIHGKNRHPSTVSFSAVGTVVNSSVTTSTTASQLYPSPELSDLDCELNVYSPNVENVSTPSQGHQEQEQEQDPQTSSWSPLATFWTPPSSPSSPSLFYTPPETPDRLESNHGTSLSGSVSPAAATIGYQTSPYSSTNDNESVELPSRLHLRLSFPYDACPHYSFLDDLHDEPPYEPVDLNSLNPELDPNDDQYYVESPVYRYVQDSETDMIRDPRNAYWNRITPGASPMETPLPGLLPQLGSFHSDEESIHQNPATPGLSSPRTPLPRLRPCLPWLSVSDDHWMEDMDDEPPYFPVDRNALYQDVDPDDDRYYVDEPVYQYVRESDSEVNSIYHENDENMFDCMYDHDRFFFEQRSLSPGYVPSDPYSDKDL